MVVFGIILAVYFLVFNLLEAAMPSLLSRITGSRGRGRRLGVYSTFQFLGAFAGGVLGGWLLGRLGSQATLVIAGLTSMVWGIVLRRYSKSVFPTGAGQ
jgi:MFS family permease